MDYDKYRRDHFTDPPPEPCFRFSGSFGTTLYFEDFEAAVAYYEAVLGPPGYLEGEGTRGWQVGVGWLTLLRGKNGNPRNVEVGFEMDTAEEAERLQKAFVAAGGEGPAPSDQLMYRPVRSCPVIDPWGTTILDLRPPQGSLNRFSGEPESRPGPARGSSRVSDGRQPCCPACLYERGHQ
jgi:hypothetical protein